MTYLKGLTDNFSALPDPSPTPDLQLLNYIINCSSPGVPLQFDEVPGQGGVPANSWFGHTFSGLPTGIVAARLEIRARATTGSGWPGTYNDHISIVKTLSCSSPTWHWQSRFANLPEAGGSWSPGDVETFCLDLDALPTKTGPVSVLSSLVNGNLRIRVDDDTGVDYVRLIIAVCPCDYVYDFEILAGVNENCKFTPPLEPASPSLALTSAYSGPWRRFDQIVSNRRFGHTFIGLQSGIVAAELELCVRAGKDKPTNDSLSLEFSGLSFAWGKRLTSLTGMAWNAGDKKKLILDLGNLPASGAGVTSVLGDMADTNLDVYLQDDTAVDYIILRYSVCCHETIPGDTNHDWVVNFLDIAIAGLHWLEKIPYP
jgi:hypothetical protein